MDSNQIVAEQLYDTINALLDKWGEYRDNYSGSRTLSVRSGTVSGRPGVVWVQLSTWNAVEIEWRNDHEFHVVGDMERATTIVEAVATEVAGPEFQARMQTIFNRLQAIQEAL